ncbi:MAG: Gx transporter family protein [Clostridiales bacterium]|nr:Gx transporter family protein [Clostridiales bacterium]
MTQSPAKKVSQVALLATLALIFSYVEMLIPYSVGIPGIKLGIANIVVLIALYTYDFKTAFSVNIIRILMAGLLFNGFFGAIYALSGGILSLLVMYLLKKTDKFSIVGVSMCGAVFHNLGQLTVAAMIVQSPKLFLYFPVLLFSGIITGILMGIICHTIYSHIPSRYLTR